MLEPIQAGEVVLPAGDEPEPFVDADDIADVAVAALTDDRHIGQHYELTSPRLLSFRAAVGEIAEATGREINYVRVSTEEYEAVMAEEGVPVEFRSFLNYLFAKSWATTLTSPTASSAPWMRARDFSEYARDAAASGGTRRR